MHCLSAAVFAIASAALACAADIRVIVGDGGLVFNPSSVVAAVGDNINFEFRAKNHSVTQSTFADPCSLMTTPKTGVDSGFQPVSATATEFPSWGITIDDASTPLWFFCAQTQPANHCNAGMVFAINPTAEKSFDAYLANAKAAVVGAPAATGSGSASSSGTPATGTPAAPTTGGSATAPTSAGSTPVVAPPASSGSATNSTGSTTSTSDNGALRLGGSASTLLAITGLVAGLML